jgi:NADPH:quinone reductase-like Zn-dependent oxidoreductase
VLFGPANESAAHLERLVAWLAEGAWTPVIDERLPLDRGAEAHARVDTGRKVGSLVLVP